MGPYGAVLVAMGGGARATELKVALIQEFNRMVPLLQKVQRFVAYGIARWHLSPASQQAFAASLCRSAGIDIPEPVVDRRYSTTELAAQYDMPPTSFGKWAKPFKLPMHGAYRMASRSNNREREGQASDRYLDGGERSGAGVRRD